MIRQQDCEEDDIMLLLKCNGAYSDKYRQMTSSSNSSNGGETDDTLKRSKTTRTRMLTGMGINNMSRKSVAELISHAESVVKQSTTQRNQYQPLSKPMFSTPIPSDAPLTRSQSVYAQSMKRSQSKFASSTYSLKNNNKTNLLTDSMESIISPTPSHKNYNVNYALNVEAFLKLENSCSKFKDLPVNHILEISNQP